MKMKMMMMMPAHDSCCLPHTLSTRHAYRKTHPHALNCPLAALSAFDLMGGMSRSFALAPPSSGHDWLAQNGYQPRWGARALNRLISTHVRRPLAEAILRGELGNGDTARVRLNRDGSGLEVVPIRANQPEDIQLAEEVEGDLDLANEVAGGEEK